MRLRLFLFVLLLILFQSKSAFADLFVSAASANSVLRFDCTTGANLGNFVTPGAGGLGDPQGIAFGPDGNLYVSSNASNNVLRFDGQTGAFIDVFASSPSFVFPAEINFRNGFLYVSDFAFAGRVSRFDANTGAFVDDFVTGITGPDGQEFDANGNIYVSDFVNGAVRRFDSNGDFVDNFVNPGSGGLAGALDNLFLPNGELLVSSFNTGSIKRYAADGTYIDDPITGLTGGAQGLEIGLDGNLYAGDFGQGLINRYDINTFALIDTFATAGTSTTNNFVFRATAIPEPGSAAALTLVMAVFGWTRMRRRV